MIKKCKWCGKESQMNGKREYCDKKCKKNYENAKYRGKLIKKEFTDEQTDNENKTVVKTLVGQIINVQTITDQYLRIKIDIPVERVNFDTIQYLNKKIVIGFVDEEKENNKKDKEPEKKRSL